MKQIITLLFVTIAYIASGQRDSLTNDYVQYADIDTTTVGGGRMTVTIEGKNRNGVRLIEVDTIPATYFADYIDSLITLYQPDSLIENNITNSIYDQFRGYNTTRLNIKNKLVKLWAIKP
jgi:hypothetical protein